MNKNAIGLHKFSRIFSGDDAVRFLCTPRADCNGGVTNIDGADVFFASTRSVQIATAEMHRIAIYTFQNAC